MFCQWARKIGQLVYLCPWMKLQHIGTYIFGGSLESLAALSHKQQEHQFATPVARDIGETVKRQSPEAIGAAEDAKTEMVTDFKVE